MNFGTCCAGDVRFGSPQGEDQERYRDERAVQETAAPVRTRYMRRKIGGLNRANPHDEEQRADD